MACRRPAGAAAGHPGCSELDLVTTETGRIVTTSACAAGLRATRRGAPASTASRRRAPRGTRTCRARCRPAASRRSRGRRCAGAWCTARGVRPAGKQCSGDVPRLALPAPAGYPAIHPAVTPRVTVRATFAIVVGSAIVAASAIGSLSPARYRRRYSGWRVQCQPEAV
jgi:hypothetical protein